MKFKQFIDEEYKTGLGVYGEIFVDPDKKELRDACDIGEGKCRFMLDFSNKSLYVWPTTIIHKKAAEVLGHMGDVPMGIYNDLTHKFLFGIAEFSGGKLNVDELDYRVSYKPELASKLLSHNYDWTKKWFADDISKQIVTYVSESASDSEPKIGSYVRGLGVLTSDVAALFTSPPKLEGIYIGSYKIVKKPTDKKVYSIEPADIEIIKQPDAKSIKIAKKFIEQLTIKRQKTLDVFEKNKIERDIMFSSIKKFIEKNMGLSSNNNIYLLLDVDKIKQFDVFMRENGYIFDRRFFQYYRKGFSTVYIFRQDDESLKIMIK